jgi:16S rRNA (cytosine1402-N4)-methyltransferase
MGTAAVIHHHAVMAQEVLTCLVHATPAVYVDCTLGGGGHARALLEASAPGSLVIGIDRDPECIAAARQWGQAWGRRFTTLQGDFRHLARLLEQVGHTQVDSLLFDLGVSSHQLDTPRRGFSFRLDGPLDMRMDMTQELTACQLIQQASQEELRTILATLGEERWAQRIAQAIVQTRQHTPFTHTTQLADIVARAIPRAAWPPRLHPATRTFLALRMAVNDELAALAQVLPQAIQVLRSGGRLGIIAFHSLEDRQVKQFFQQEARGCLCPPQMLGCVCGHKPQLRLWRRKPLSPLPEEMHTNPRSRSARLRVAEKLEVEE